MLAAAAVGLRPDAFAAGLARVLWGGAAYLGTIAAGVVPGVALGAAFLTSRRLSERGDSVALAGLGLGPMACWRSLWPLWAGLSGLVLLLAFAGEPPAWRAVHQLKGAPEAAAVAWARLQAGEVRVLPQGGALVAHDGRLRFATGDGQWRGSFAAAAARPEGGDWGWTFGSAQLRHKDGSEWRARRVRLRPDPQWLASYRAPPRSPWAERPARLISERCGPEQSAEGCQRAALVLHRRLCLAALVPAVACIGWLLGWSVRREGRRSAGGREAAVLGVAVGLYALLKLGEKMVALELVPGALGAWLPALPVAFLVWWAVRRAGAAGR